jgi:uroporphyrinogen decarboxylase
MLPKERVLTALACGVPDRVPINYFAVVGSNIDLRLKRHFGLTDGDGEGLLKALGVDFRKVVAPYKGPKLHPDDPARGMKADEWGIRRRWIENISGGYWDYVDFPLQEANEEQVAAWPLPNPDHFDYSNIYEECRSHQSYAIMIGGSGVCDIINSTGMLRGMEQALVDLITDDPAGTLLARRRTEIHLEVMRRTLEAAKGQISLFHIGEDLGTQIGPMISLDLYRQRVRPLHQRFLDLAKSFNIPLMIHSCGCSSWAFEDFIQMGVKAVDTLQPEVVNMQPEYLKKNFGGRLCFHGCISTAGPVATGSAQDVVSYCRNTLEIMKPGGGYCFSPTHNLQDNSPTENVVAAYQTAREYGSYA